MNSGIKSLLSPRGVTKTPQQRRQSVLPMHKTPSRANLSGRLNHSSSQILHKSASYIVEHFGSQLPVLVTEALKFSDGNSAASVNISNDGWAWFVCGRRLLVWQTTANGRPINAQCRELSLPPSDLAHRAHLVTVYTQQASQMPCCLAVSPEGLVRYWSSVAHESSWTEVNAELQGQECDSLHLLHPLGALLVTTTATLILVTPHFAAARHTLLCRTIRAPHGWLGGISRKMSSLIFGSIPANQIMETKLVKVVTGGLEGEWTVQVLAGHALQKWLLTNGELEQLLFEADLARPLREAFNEADNDVQELLLLDMQASLNGVMLLVAAAQDPAHVTYALVAVSTETAPLSVGWFRQLTAEELGPLAHSTQTPADSPLQFLLMEQVALLYNAYHIVTIPVLSGKGEVELLDFGSGYIVGGALYRKLPIFFSTFNGFISVSSIVDSPNNISQVMNDLAQDSTISDSNIEELTQQKDNVGLLKAAFLLYIRKQLVQSRAAIDNLFSGEPGSVDATLGTAALRTSLELIDDVPAKDPRWADHKSTKLNIGSSNSLQIVHQLEEKQRVLQWYVSFLKDLQLWDKLGSVTHANRVISTTYVLQEHAEKVAATIALKKAHSNHAELVDKIIEEVLSKHNKRPIGSLTNQDLFYRQVSLVDEAVRRLVSWAETTVFTEQNPQQAASHLAEANTLLLEMLRAVSELRESVGTMYQPTSPGVWEKKLWTTATGPQAVGDALLFQMQLTAGQHGVKGAGEPQLRAELLDQLLSLVDCVLDGRATHVQSLRDTPNFTATLHQYEADRLSYIQLFMAEEEYERAAMLAEKYLDFQVLIEICHTNNKEKLNSYIEKFNSQGFSKFLFAWYIREGKQSSLVQHCSEKGGEQLVPLLSEHPTLAWLHDLALNNYSKVSDTLKSLAKAETQLLQRKKTQLSLAKLALLASPEMAPDVADLTSELGLIAFQEHLPEPLLTFYGYDTDNMRLFTPSELVKLYISDENECTEFAYKTALDILSYVEDDQEKKELSNEIWSKAVSKDTWIDMDPNSPQSAIQQLFFFRLIDLCILEGCEDMVPTIQNLLTSEELSHLKDDNTFQYLLQVGYENFTKDSVL